MDKPGEKRDQGRQVDQGDQRAAHRFDKVFPVMVQSDDFGECQGIARNISAGGMFVEMMDPLPLGSVIRIHFVIPDSQGELVARGEVKRQYFLQFSDALGPRALTGMGVRFTRFEEDASERLDHSLRTWQRRTLH